MSVIGYRCYRELLRDLYLKKKNEILHFSYQYIANHLNTGKTYLKLIMEKKRHISIEKIPEISKLFELNEVESQIFLFLFLKCTSKEEKLAIFFQKVINILEGNCIEQQNVKSRKVLPINLLDDWLMKIIHSMAKMKGFEPNSSWIKNRLIDPNIEIIDIEKCLEKLLNEQLIIYKEGKWQPNEFIYSMSPTIGKTDSHIFALGLNRILQALPEIYNHRPYSFKVMSIDIKKDDQYKIIQLYSELTEKLIKISENTSEADLIMFVSNNIITEAVEKLN